MGYTYTCNDCGDTKVDEDPAFMGQINERWFMTTDRGGVLANNGLSSDETYTFCPDCTEGLLL